MKDVIQDMGLTKTVANAVRILRTKKIEQSLFVYEAYGVKTICHQCPIEGRDIEHGNDVIEVGYIEGEYDPELNEDYFAPNISLNLIGDNW
jgi:hypothetical protein